MNKVRENARSVRMRVESGDLLSMDEAVAACVTLSDALSVFEGSRETDDGVMPICCGADVELSGGWMGQIARCPRCGTEIRDAIGPMSSPFLERGNSFVTVPGEGFYQLFGERTWIVMHEGDRP